MSQATLPERPYVNSNLFSGHYLDERGATEGSASTGERGVKRPASRGAREGFLAVLAPITNEHPFGSPD